MVNNKRLFIDTSGFYALLDKNDKNHSLIETVINQFDIFFTSNYIIDELITLTRVRKLKTKKLTEFINDLIEGNICPVLRVTLEIERAAWKMSQKYSDQNFSFTDCTSFILMKENEIRYACSLDKHFVIAGFSLAEKV